MRVVLKHQLLRFKTKPLLIISSVSYTFFSVSVVLLLPLLIQELLAQVEKFNTLARGLSLDLQHAHGSVSF